MGYISKSCELVRMLLFWGFLSRNRTGADAGFLASGVQISIFSGFPENSP